MKPKLQLELVPRTCWGQNVRKVVSDKTWHELRYKYGAHNHSCLLCGEDVGASPLELHEIWEYDDYNKKQILTGFQPICAICHEVKHLGRTIRVGNGERAIFHLAKINQWNPQEVIEHVKHAMDIWEARSKAKYELDIGFLNDELPKSKIHMDWLDEDRQVYRGSFDAHMWSQNMLMSKNTIILDTETTGLPQKKKNVEVIQVSAIDTRGEIIFDYLIRPKYKIPLRTTKIHGISQDDVKNAPLFPEIYEELSDHLRGKTVIAYNAKFDKEVLSRTCNLYKLSELSPNKWLCAAKPYRAYREFPKSCPLPGATHSAVDDCFAVLEIMVKMATNPNPW